MNFWGSLVLGTSLAWSFPAAFAATGPAAADPPAAASALAGAQASADALYAERWVRERGDDHGRPFVIVDKKAARIFVFAAGGALAGAAPAILGLSRGDVAVPGAGSKDPARLLPDERRTPAGRFESQPGTNLHGEAVVWVDYDTGIAIHRVRPGASQRQRLRSLADAGVGERRLSLGCVVVPEAFFLAVVLPVMGQGRGTVYVLPEDGPVQALFAQPAAGRLATAAGGERGTATAAVR